MSKPEERQDPQHIEPPPEAPKEEPEHKKMWGKKFGRNGDRNWTAEQATGDFLEKMKEKGIFL